MIFVTVFNCFAAEKNTTAKTMTKTVTETIPSVYITTQNSQVISSKENWIPGSIIIKCDVDSSTEIIMEQQDLLIKGRGNSTWTNVPKKPYGIKFNKPLSVLGMKESTRWVLLANYFDNSFIKNDIAFYLARSLEMEYVPNGRFVNLYLNSKYRGLYWLGEQVRVEKNRVTINSQKDFLLEADDFFDEKWKFKSEQGLPYQIKNDDGMSEKRLEFIQKKVNQLEQKLYTPNFPYLDEEHKKLDLSYKRYLDTESFVKFWIVQELVNNYDPNHPRSCYMTYSLKRKNFVMGPVWDFDWSLVNKNVSSWQCKSSLYYDQLFKSPAFVKAVKKIWNQYYNEIEGVIDYSQKLSAQIKPYALEDRQRWPIANKNSWSPGFIDQGSYNAEIKFVQNCLSERIKWMNKKISEM